MKSPPRKGRPDDPRAVARTLRSLGALAEKLSKINGVHKSAQRVSGPFALIMVNSHVNFSSGEYLGRLQVIFDIQS